MLQSTVILLHCVCSKVNIFAMNLDFRENRAIVCFGGLFFGFFFFVIKITSLVGIQAQFLRL